MAADARMLTNAFEILLDCAAHANRPFHALALEFRGIHNEAFTCSTVAGPTRLAPLDGSPGRAADLRDFHLPPHCISYCYIYGESRNRLG